MLLSSFLGLNVGAMASGRKRHLFGWFPVLLAVDIAALLWCRHLILGTSGSEVRFGATKLQLTNYAILSGLFVVNALVFVPVGQQMGILFSTLPRLKAYAWDLGSDRVPTGAESLISLTAGRPTVAFSA